MPRILEIAGLIVWFMVGLPVLIQGGANSTSLTIGWAIAYLLFAALFIADFRWPLLSLLAMQAACVIVVVAILCDGFEGTLLVLIAIQLGARVDRKTGLIWIAVQTALLAAAIAFHWTGRSSFLLTPASPLFTERGRT